MENAMDVDDVMNVMNVMAVGGGADAMMSDDADGDVMVVEDFGDLAVRGESSSFSSTSTSGPVFCGSSSSVCVEDVEVEMVDAV